jgi:hypothetical protein
MILFTIPSFARRLVVENPFQVVGLQRQARARRSSRSDHPRSVLADTIDPTPWCISDSTGSQSGQGGFDAVYAAQGRSQGKMVRRITRASRGISSRARPAFLTTNPPALRPKHRARMGHADSMAGASPRCADMPRLSERSEFSGVLDFPWSLGLQRSPHI